MFAIGDSLREARTRRGLSPADVHKSIRIRERYLTALEEERWELLPGEAYTKGFLRTYAEFLGLDGNLYVDEFNTRISHGDEELVPPSLVAVHRSRRGVLRMLMALLVLGGIIAGVAALGMGGSPSSGGPAEQPVAKHVAKGAPVVAPTVTTKPDAVTPLTKTKTVISTARGRSWLLIRTGGPTGPIVYQGVLEQGKSLYFSLGHPLWVRMGRPDNVDISLGGRLVGALPATPANMLLTRSGARSA
jgi:Helix-turn-helix domain/RodZ C-terminal domain